MIVYFDSNGVVKEIITDYPVRQGSTNQIFCYFEDETAFTDLMIVLRLPDGSLSTQISIIDNTEDKTIAYNKKADYKYFVQGKTYSGYYYTLTQSDLLYDGLGYATITGYTDSEVITQGLVTFNIESSVLKTDNLITQSQYEYLLTLIASRTLNEQTASDLYNTIEQLVIANIGVSPSVFDTAENILALTSNQGVAVATDTGYIYHWNDENSVYENTGLLYVGDIDDYAKKDGSNVTDFAVGNDLSVGGDITASGTITGKDIVANNVKANVIATPLIENLAEKGNAIGRGWADLTRFSNYVKTENYRIGGYVVGTYEPDYRSNDACDSVEFDLPNAVLKFKIGTNVFTNVGVIYKPNDKAFLCNQTDSYSYYRIDNGYVYVDCQYFIDNGYTKIALSFDKGDIDITNVYDDYSDYIYNSTNVVHSNAQLCDAKFDGEKVNVKRLDFTALSDFNIRYGEYMTGYNASTYKPTFTINTTLAVAVMEFAIPSNHFWLKMPISDNAIAHTQAVVLYTAGTKAVNIVYNNSSLLSLWMIIDGFIYINTQIALSAGYTHIAINIDLDEFYIEDCEKILDKPMYIPMRVFGDFGVVGDSFTRGDAFGSGGTNYIKPNYSWGATIAGRNNMHYSNYGYGGANTRTYFSTEAYTRLMSDDVKPFYIFDLGINDLALGEAYIGTISDIDLNDYTNNADTFYGNYGKLISQVLARNGNARIVLLSIAIPLYFNTKRTAFNTAIEAIATLFNVPFINLEDDGYFHSKVYQKMSTNHPTLVAYGGMGLAIERLISQCILDNQDYFKYVGLEDSTNYFTKYALTGGTGIDVNDNVVSINSTYQTKISTLETSLSTANAKIEVLERETANLKQASTGNTMQEVTTSGLAYTYTIPSATLPYGYLNKVGGMSYKTTNLLNMTSVSDTTINDVTYTINSDYSVTLSGTSSARNQLSIGTISLTAGTYTIANLGNRSSNIDIFAVYTISGTTTYVDLTAKTNNYKSFTLSEVTSVGVKIDVKQASVDTSGYTIKPMLVSGSTAPTTYKPYFSGIRHTAVTSVSTYDSNSTLVGTKPIPASVQALDGYGWGLSQSVNNYADFDNNVFGKMVAREKIKNLTWSYDSSTYRFYTTISDMKTSSSSRNIQMLLEGYDCKYSGETYDSTWDMVIYNVASYVYLSNTSFSSVDTFLASEGEKYIYYPLATPTTTDISGYLDADFDLLTDLEGNGTLVFDNPYGQEAFYEIFTYEKL